MNQKKGSNQANRIMKIITHPGAFHADELLAIATVHAFQGTFYPVERKPFVTPEELADPRIMVLDIGGQFNAELNNFDHHQDNAGLESTNVLVLRHFCQNNKLRAKLEQKLYLRVSQVDRGIKLPASGDEYEFSSIVKQFNSMPDGFQAALSTVIRILDAYIANAYAAIDGEAYWEQLDRLHFGLVVEECAGKLIPDWQELARRENVIFLSSPNARGGWQLVSRDSQLFTIPIHDSQTYRHDSGFMAVYATKEAAMNHLRGFISFYHILAEK